MVLGDRGGIGFMSCINNHKHVDHQPNSVIIATYFDLCQLSTLHLMTIGRHSK
jgi:hypothetical protein